LVEEYYGNWLNGRAVLLFATDIQYLILYSYTNVHSYTIFSKNCAFHEIYADWLHFLI
jgi:hypothetical protein